MSKPPIFSNRHNEEIQLPDSRTIWISRACAVVAHVMLYQASQKQWYVLLGKRGESTPDFQGYWGLPCGYLDWDETLTQAMVREVWEECGVYLPHIAKDPSFVWSENACVTKEEDFNETPWVIADVPKHQKQNISMHYAVLFSWRGSEFPSLSDAYAEPGEVAGIEWVALEEAFQMELAFNHANRIRELWENESQRFRSVEENSG